MTGNHNRGWTLAFVYLIEDHPVGVNLRVPLWVQHYGLIGSEVGEGDLSVLWAVVDSIDDIVFVKVPFARISNTVLWNTMAALRNRTAGIRILYMYTCRQILTVCVYLVYVDN